MIFKNFVTPSQLILKPSFDRDITYLVVAVYFKKLITGPGTFP